MLFITSCKKDNIVSSNDNDSTAVTRAKYCGVRSSNYGIKPFPSAEGWVKAMSTMSNYFPGSVPGAIWIVGTISEGVNCRLEFPSEGKDIANVIFSDTDKHEPYLDHFDQHGIKVFLQVESADADMLELIDAVLSRYGQHNCVAGFGVDIEWYHESSFPDRGRKITDAEAEMWEGKVKSYNNQYKLFLKHWDQRYMPSNYRGDIIFVTDSQEFINIKAMLNEFIDWADYFKPNTVFFQYGYNSDKHFWELLDNPPKVIGDSLYQKVEQDMGFFWVDFTLKDVLPIN